MYYFDIIKYERKRKLFYINNKRNYNLNWGKNNQFELKINFINLL